MRPDAVFARVAAGYCWGLGSSGQNGDGAQASRREVVATGALHVCVLDRGGYAHCGGRNHAGQLGEGTATHRAALVPVIAPATGS